MESMYENKSSPDVYILENVRSRHIAKFNVRGYDYRLKLLPLDKGATVSHIHDVLEGMHFVSVIES